MNIYDDRIEFVSLGGLVPGLDLDSIFLGVSQSRNPNLAALFYRMRLIESYGTGIGKIKRSYQGSDKVPVFETAAGAFRVTLPNRNESRSVTEEIPIQETRRTSSEKQNALIMEYACENGSITRQEAEELLHAGTTKAFKVLKALCTNGQLKVEGSGNRVRYIPV